MALLQPSKQRKLNLPLRSESNPKPAGSSERAIASYLTETPAGKDRLMEIICEQQNLRRALQRVRANKGAPGIDGMSVDQLTSYLRRHWPKIRTDLLEGTYQPLPVRRKEIPKPSGGVRLLGIPTALDRLVQQAVGQVLQQIWNPSFSDSSFGFRPGRNQHQAIKRAQEYVVEGYRNVVDMDLSKFFDRVNHDRLMSRLSTKVHDKRVLKLVRRFLTAGVMIGGLQEPSHEGTPQGGPLSPLLSNIVLDELDKELEKRRLRFVRYADDFIIFVRSKRAAERVMKSVSLFINRKLRLKVNLEKSRITYPWWMCFLGFSFISRRGDSRIRIHSKSIKRFKQRVRELTGRSGGLSMAQIISRLNLYFRGWWGYFGITQSLPNFRSLHYWILRRLRAILWKHWKNPRTRIRELRKRKIPHRQAVFTGCSRKGPWRMSRVKWVMFALPKSYFGSLGLLLPGLDRLS